MDAEPAELLRWSVSRTGSEVVVTLVGEMDMSNAPAFKKALGQLFQRRPRRVTIDLANLSYLDSSGIRCLVDAAERGAAFGCELALHNPTPAARRVMEITGVAELLLHQSSEPVAESH